jgi:hypothetical protein
LAGEIYQVISIAYEWHPAMLRDPSKTTARHHNDPCHADRRKP